VPAIKKLGKAMSFAGRALKKKPDGSCPECCDDPGDGACWVSGCELSDTDNGGELVLCNCNELNACFLCPDPGQSLTSAAGESISQDIQCVTSINGAVIELMSSGSADGIFNGQRLSQGSATIGGIPFSIVINKPILNNIVQITAPCFGGVLSVNAFVGFNIEWDITAEIRLSAQFEQGVSPPCGFAIQAEVTISGFLSSINPTTGLVFDTNTLGLTQACVIRTAASALLLNFCELPVSTVAPLVDEVSLSGGQVNYSGTSMLTMGDGFGDPCPAATVGPNPGTMMTSLTNMLGMGP